MSRDALSRKSETAPMNDLGEFREYLDRSHGTDYGATDDQLLALIDRAKAKRQALGYGSVFVMAASMLRENAVDGERDG